MTERTFISHPQAEAVLAELELIYAHQIRTGEGLGFRLTGPTNVGKSKIMKEFLRRHPPVETETVTLHSVIYVHLPERARVDDAYIGILRATKDPAALVGTEKTRRYRVRDILDAVHNSILMFDEPHHLTEQRSSGARLGVTQLSKSLQELGRGIVYGGVKSVDDLAFESDELARRFRGAMRLRPYSARSMEEMQALRRFCNSLGSTLKGVEPEQFGSDDRWFSRLLVSSQGTVGNVAQLADLAATHAVSESSAKLSLGHFSKAWRTFATSMEENLQALKRGHGRNSTLLNVFEMSDDEVLSLLGEMAGKEAQVA